MSIKSAQLQFSAAENKCFWWWWWWWCHRLVVLLFLAVISRSCSWERRPLGDAALSSAAVTQRWSSEQNLQQRRRLVRPGSAASLEPVNRNSALHREETAQGNKELHRHRQTEPEPEPADSLRRWTGHKAPVRGTSWGDAAKELRGPAATWSGSSSAPASQVSSAPRPGSGGPGSGFWTEFRSSSADLSWCVRIRVTLMVLVQPGPCDPVQTGKHLEPHVETCRNFFSR